MAQEETQSQFESPLLCPRLKKEEPWGFVVLPLAVSEKLPRRGRTSIEGTVNGHAFTATLEPDGNKSHWLRIDESLMQAAGVHFGDVLHFDIQAVAQEPEPEVPEDMLEALQAVPEAWETWLDTTTLARVDWVHWATSAKQAKTRTKRIHDACDMLSSGKKKVCCFDPSGYYSKAFKAPQAVEPTLKI